MRAISFAGLVATVGLVAACSGDTHLNGPTPNNAIFASYVALGNSITAGYQSGGINDSTQQQSYAVLVARQMNTRFAYPSLVKPGCPPPIANFQTQARVGGSTSTSTTCFLRQGITATLNNVAVPGITSFDPTASGLTAPDTNPLMQLILGGQTMVQKALDANPTFATVWVGNNDILEPAIEGLPDLATPTGTFIANYAKMMNQLVQGAPGIKGVLIGVVQVAAAPVMFTAQALQSPLFLGALSVATGKVVTADPTTCTGSTSLIAIEIVAAIKAGQLPPTIYCAKTGHGLLGNLFVLDAGEQAQVAATVSTYNAYIQAKADSIGFAYYDPNTTLARLATQDPVLASHVPNLASGTATFGQFVTLDGIHPSAAAHIQIADDLIAVINKKYGTNLSPVPTP